MKFITKLSLPTGVMSRIVGGYFFQRTKEARFTTLVLLAIAGWQSCAFCAQEVAAAAQAIPNRTKSWIASEQLAVTRELAEQQRRVADAQTAITKAQSALNLAYGYKDAEAEPIAQHALATANEALALARRHLAEQQQRAANLKLMLERTPADMHTDDAVALPQIMRGDVRVKSGSKTIPMEPTRVLQLGDEVIVGDKSFVQLSLSDGHVLQLRENSVFTIERQPKKIAMGMIEQYWHNLKQGTERIHRYGQTRVLATLGSVNDEYRYRAVAAVAAVRGTDFQMEVGTDGLGRLTLFDGRIELAADAAANLRDKLKPWWLVEHIPVYAALPERAVARIAALRGEAAIIARDKSSRPAHAGEVMAAGERIETAAGAMAHLDLVRGQRIALGGNVRFTSVLDQDAPLYALGLGHAHVWSDGQPSQFLTPNAVTESHTREFEVTVLADGAAEYTPLEGSLDISASEKKLDWSKIDTWWDR